MHTWEIILNPINLYNGEEGGGGEERGGKEEEEEGRGGGIRRENQLSSYLYPSLLLTWGPY